MIWVIYHNVFVIEKDECVDRFCFCSKFPLKNAKHLFVSQEKENLQKKSPISLLIVEDQFNNL